MLQHVAVSRFDRDVLSQPNIKWVIFSDDPINDLGGANPPTAQAEIDQIANDDGQCLCQRGQILCSTPGHLFAGGAGAHDDQHLHPQSGSGCDGIVDQDTATHDPPRLCNGYRPSIRATACTQTWPACRPSPIRSI